MTIKSKALKPTRLQEMDHEGGAEDTSPKPPHRRGEEDVEVGVDSKEELSNIVEDEKTPETSDENSIRDFSSKHNEGGHGASGPLQGLLRIDDADLYDQVLPLPPAVQSNHLTSLPGAHAVAGPGYSSSRIPRQRVSQAHIEDAAVVGDDEVPMDSPAQTMPVDEVIEGTVMKATTRPVRPSYLPRNWIVALVVVSFAAVAILVVVLLLPSSSESESRKDTDETLPPTLYAEMRFPPFQEGLPMDVRKEIAELGSSFYKANAWAFHDPNINAYSPERMRHRFLMVYLYYQTNGDTWFHNDHWLSYNISECEWFNRNSSVAFGGWHPGMEPYPVCDNQGNLLALNLSSNNLHGENMVSSSLGFGAELRIGDLSNNDLFGVPPAMAMHASLMEVYSISNNSFDGRITGGGGFSAFNLRIIQLDGNKLYGVPTGFFAFLPSLEVLNVTNNRYSLPLDDEMKYCKNLTYIGFGENDYIGPLVTEIGILSKLQTLDVSNNFRLTGTIPTEFCQLTKLGMLDISGTSVHGAIPDCLCAAFANQSLRVVANCSAVQCCK